MSTEDIARQYLNSQINLNDIKQVNLDADQEYNKFKEKLKVFEGITSISKAKEIAETFLPCKNEKTYLTVGNAKCVIISRGDVFRVCLNSDKEYTCYNIVKKSEDK